MKENTIQHTDVALSEILQKEQDSYKKLKLMGSVGAVLAGLGYLMGGFLGTILLCVGATMAVLGSVGVMQAKNDAKTNVGAHIVEAALHDVFTEVDFFPQEHISNATIWATDMGFPFSYNEISGSDLVRAVYKNVNIEMSDIKLMSVQTILDDDGKERSKEHVDFQGLWLICDFGKKLSADLNLAERRAGVWGKVFKSGIQTENEDFNKRFKISSDSEHDAFYILTPHLMEYILQMDDKGGGTTYMRFLREGKLHVAMHTGKDLFEIGEMKNIDVASLRQQFVDEIKYVTDLLDELLKSETLFLKM